MKREQSGFTLIELVMVIVILGILAATAIPSFTDVSAQAQQAATEGMAGALGSASAINYAVRSLNSSNGVPVANCPAVATALEGTLDSDYTITPDATTPIAPGATATCTVTGPTGAGVTFIGHGIS